MLVTFYNAIIIALLCLVLSVGGREVEKDGKTSRSYCGKATGWF